MEREGFGRTELLVCVLEALAEVSTQKVLLTPTSLALVAEDP